MFASEPTPEPVVQPLPKEQQIFDYTALDTETRIVVQQRTSEIKSLMRQTVQETIEIGQKLIDVKQKLEHGQFGNWIRAEFSWGWTTACKFMNVAETLKFSQCENLTIGTSALYLIGSPSTPQEARQEILARAKKGEKIKYNQARKIVARYKADKDKSITFDNPPETPETATVGIDPKKEPLEDDSAAGKEQSKKEEQGKEAHLAEPEMSFSSKPPVLLPELVLDDAAGKDQSKEELHKKEYQLGQNEANDDASQTQEQVLGEKDRVIGDRLESEELPLFNETGNQAGQDEAEAKANQSPQSLEDGIVAYVAENPEEIEVMPFAAPVEQQHQRIQTLPGGKPNYSTTKADLSDRTCLRTYDDLDAIIFDNDLHYISAEQLAVWIVATPYVTKERLSVPTWPKADLERVVAELERITTELKQELQQRQHL